MVAIRLCHSSRTRHSLHPFLQFGQWKFTSLSDFNYRETLAVARDAAEKRQLEETSKRLASALDQVMEVIAILDARNGTIIYSNALFLEIFGNAGQGAPKQKFMNLFECQILATALEQAGAGRAWTGRSSLKTLAGRRITFEGTVSPVRNIEGIIESLVVRLRDITLEVEKDRHLRQAQKMDALGALAGGMAHDFNNLIGAILNAAELIEMQVGPDSPIQKKLAIIQQVGGRAKELSTQILNFSRRRDDQWTPFDLTGLVREVTNLFQTALPRNVEVQSDLAEGIRILGDPSQLHQVIMNLGINGSQAMQPGGGVLSVRLQRLEAGRRVADQPFPEPCVLLTIKDTGCGMDPHTLERIFEPFFTTKEAGHGTGLGLSVVYGIIQGHGGHLHVSSELGKGSSFKIRLPIFQDLHKGLDERTTESRVSNHF
jgi:two-component system, cell cycle sensor histidine kinase and response regulator CckA